MDSSACVTLRNGVKMPLLGLGTSHQGGSSQEAVEFAIKECGYRLVDTAMRYGTEQLVGNAVKETGVQRQDLFLTTKLWPSFYGHNSCLEQAKASMAKLGTDYLDLYLLHWPGAQSKRQMEETWRAMELLMERGDARAIGVSNFQERHLDRLVEHAAILPHVNQVEFHPWQNDKALRTYCRENKIRLDGYSPLAKGSGFLEPSIVEIAKFHNKEPAQILIKWSIQNDVVTIPKSTKKERIQQNCDVWNFVLSHAQMQILDGLHCNARVTWDPSDVP